jgi:hypothetical protein
MNLVDAYVTEILDQPYEMYGKWWLEVVADIYGREGESKLMFNTREEAENVIVGHHFLT